MNIIHDGLYTNDNTSLLTKTKTVVKMAIKTTAYTAFLAIAVASSLHLYNNPEDRIAVKNGLSQIGAGIEGKINGSAMELTGHNVTSQITKVSNFAEKSVDTTIAKVKEFTPSTEDAKTMASKIEKAGDIAVAGIKQESPGIEKQVQKDVAQAPVKATEEVKYSIKQIRQYTGDLAQRLANAVKP